MQEPIRRRISYANVTATLALFVALGGGAYAIGLGKNDVRSRNIAPKAVKTSDLAKRAVKRSKIAANAVTGAEVNESTLAAVPNAANADLFDGLDSVDFMRGAGRIHAALGSDAPSGSPSAPISLDLGGNLTLDCNNPASAGSTFTFTNTSGQTADVWTDRIQKGFADELNQNYFSVANGDTASLQVPGPIVGSGLSLLRFTIAIAGRLSMIEARLTFDGDECRFTTLVSELRA